MKDPVEYQNTRKVFHDDSLGEAAKLQLSKGRLISSWGQNPNQAPAPRKVATPSMAKTAAAME